MISYHDPIPIPIHPSIHTLQPCLGSHRRCFLTSLSTFPCFYPPWLHPHIPSLFTPSLLFPSCQSVDGPSAVPPNGPRAARRLTCTFTFTHTLSWSVLSFLYHHRIASHIPRTQPKSLLVCTPLTRHEQDTGAHRHALTSTPLHRLTMTALPSIQRWQFRGNYDASYWNPNSPSATSLPYLSPMTSRTARCR
jgi:hypothetical protein